MNKEQNCHRAQNTKNSQNGGPHTESAYDDSSIPGIDPDEAAPAQPLPESFRPRKDGPGGN